MAMTSSNKMLAAGLIGFAAGILYAPRKGTETQAQLKEKFDRVKQDASEKADKAKQKVKDMRSDMKKKEKSAMEKADKKMDEATEVLVP